MKLPTYPSGGIEYHPVVSESDRLSTYMGLDDYDTLFEARHGRGALDHMPKTSGEMVTTSYHRNDSYYLECRSDSKPNG